MFLQRMFGLSFISLFIFALILSACGKKQVIKPSEDAVKARGALASLTAIKDAYEAKDMGGVISHVSSGYGRGLAELQTSLRKDFENFDQIAIELKTDRVEIEGDKVKVASHWFGKWQDKAGKERESRGNAVFVFKDAGGKIQLADVIGDSPIGISR